jgi:hypothetical protein
MPCRDGGPDVVYEEKLHNGVNAARLCAVFKVLESKDLLTKVLDAVDWKGAGVSRTGTDNWWEKHQKIDATRKELKKKERLNMKKAKALSLKSWASLSKAERQLVNRYVD